MQSGSYHLSHFFFNDTVPTEIYTLSLQRRSSDLKLKILGLSEEEVGEVARAIAAAPRKVRSEEHTSELQSRRDLVCRLLLEKKKNFQCRYFGLSLEDQVCLIVTMSSLVGRLSYPL